MLVQMIICHGEEVIFRNVEDENGVAYNLSVSQYIDYDLSADGLKFQNPLFNRVLREAVEHNADEDFKAEPYFLNHPEQDISRLAADMSVDRYQLLESLRNKSGIPEAKEVSEKNRISNLRNQTLHLIADFRMDYVERHLLELKKQISDSQGDAGKMLRLMKEYTDMQQIRNALAKKLGNEIIV